MRYFELGMRCVQRSTCLCFDDFGPKTLKVQQTKWQDKPMQVCTTLQVVGQMWIQECSYCEWLCNMHNILKFIFWQEIGCQECDWRHNWQPRQ